MPVDKNKVLATALNFVQKGQYDKAIKEYTKLLELDPKDAKVLQRLGDLYRKMGKNVEAVDSFKKVADIFAQGGFFSKAVAVYRQIETIQNDLGKGDDPAIITKIAELNEQMGLVSEAYRAYQKLLEIYEKEEYVTDALAVIKRMTKIEPDNIPLRLKLAEGYMRSNMRDEGIAEYRALLDEMKTKDKEDEYIRVMERLLHHTPEDKARQRELALIYLKRGENRRALLKIQDCIKLDPNDAATLDLLAKLFKIMGQSDKAALVYLQIAELMGRQGGIEDVKEAYKKALSVDPANPTALTALHKLEGGRGGATIRQERVVMSQSDEPAAGRRQSQRTAPGQEEQPQRRNRTGAPAPQQDARAQRDHLKQAFATAPRKLNEEDSDPNLLLVKGKNLQRAGKSEEAIATFEKVLKLAPQNKDALSSLRLLYIKKYDYERTREMFLRELQIAVNEANKFQTRQLIDNAVDLFPKDPVFNKLADQLNFLSPKEVAIIIKNALENNKEMFAKVKAANREAIDIEVTDEDDYAIEPVAGAIDGSGIDYESDIEIDKDFEPEPEIAVIRNQGQYEEEIEFSFDAPMPEFGEEESEVVQPQSKPRQQAKTFKRQAEIDKHQRDRRGYYEPEPEPEYAEEIEEDIPASDYQSEEVLLDDGELEPYEDSRIADEVPLSQEIRYVSEKKSKSEDSEYDLYEEKIDRYRYDDAAMEEDLEFAKTANADDFVEVVDESESSELELDELPLEEDTTVVKAAGDNYKTLEELDDEEAQFLKEIGAVDSKKQPNKQGDSAPKFAPPPLQAGDSFENSNLDALNLFEGMEEESSKTASSDDIAQFLEEAQFFFESGLFDECLELLDEAEKKRSDKRVDELRQKVRDRLKSMETLPSHMSHQGKAAAIMEENIADNSFDLAAEIMSDIEDEEDFYEKVGQSDKAPTQISAEDVLEQFKKGVSQQVKPNDYETHYNLGVAYREMALYDEAIEEFRICLGSQERQFDGLLMIAMCYVGKGNADMAEKLLTRALQIPNLEKDVIKNIYYELGLLYEESSDLSKALLYYRIAMQHDPKFRNVREKVKDLVEEGVKIASSEDNLIKMLKRITGGGENDDGDPTNSNKISYV